MWVKSLMNTLLNNHGGLPILWGREFVVALSLLFLLERAEFIKYEKYWQFKSGKSLYKKEEKW
tara:strand:- start:614 stop:802 length:189 start_codon:yes stop_codon:yes gene_type:complete